MPCEILSPRTNDKVEVDRRIKTFVAFGTAPADLHCVTGYVQGGDGVWYKGTTVQEPHTTPDHLWVIRFTFDDLECALPEGRKRLLSVCAAGYDPNVCLDDQSLFLVTYYSPDEKEILDDGVHISYPNPTGDEPQNVPVNFFASGSCTDGSATVSVAVRRVADLGEVSGGEAKSTPPPLNGFWLVGFQVTASMEDRQVHAVSDTSQDTRQKIHNVSNL